MRSAGDAASARNEQAELLAAPAAALSPEIIWRQLDTDRVTASVPVGDEVHEVTLTVTIGWALTELVMTRWGNPGKQGFGEHSFGAALHGQSGFGGFTVPREISAGWHYGTDRWPDGLFIRSVIDEVRYG